MSWKVDWTSTPEAMFAGVAPPKDAPPQVSQAQAAPIVPARSLGERIKSGIVGAVTGLWESIKDGFSKALNWAKSNPIQAGLIVAGAVVGGVLILKAGAIGALIRIGGAAIKMVGSIPKLIGAVKSAAAGAALTSGASALSKALLTTPAAIAKTSLAGAKSFLGKVAGNKLAQIAATAASGQALVAGMHFLARESQQLWNFNWQQSDQSIMEQQKGIVTSIAAAGGEAAGQIAGSLLCGGTARAAQVRVNVPLIAKLKTLLNEEQADIVQDAIEDLIYVTRQGVKQIAALEMYSNVRAWLRDAGKNGKTGIKELDRALASWGAPGQEAWSFASAMEEKIETIPNDILRAFVEEAAEGFGEGCYEAVLAVR